MLMRPSSGWSSRPIVQLSVGREESQLLVYEEIAEVIVSDRHLLYRLKLFEDKPVKVLKVKEFGRPG